MVVLIDTNIILDVLLKRSPFDTDAYEIIKMADSGSIKAYISASSVTDIYYIIKKNLGHEKSIKAIKSLLLIMDVVSVTKNEIEKAILLPEFNDLEDALQFQCSKKIKAAYLITRDVEFLKLTEKAISPRNFIELK